MLNGENAGVLLVDTSNDEMNVDQSQQQNWSHSSSSATPSQSGDGPNSGGLSPIDDNDGHSGDRGEIRSSILYRGEYEVGTTSKRFRDRSEFDGNMFRKPRRDRSEPRAPSKGKGKKHTSLGSSSSRRSSSNNLGYSDSSTSTQGFYPPNQPSYFQPAHVIHNHMVIIHHFLIMVCHISLKCILHHQCITHFYLSCILLLKYILHINYMKIKVKMLLFLDIFLDKGYENQVNNALKVKVSQ